MAFIKRGAMMMVLLALAGTGCAAQQGTFEALEAPPCYDGECEIKLIEPREIRFGPEVDFTSMWIVPPIDAEIDDTAMTVLYGSEGLASWGQHTASSTWTAGSLEVQYKEVDDGAAVFVFRQVNLRRCCGTNPRNAASALQSNQNKTS